MGSKSSFPPLHECNNQLKEYNARKLSKLLKLYYVEASLSLTHLPSSPCRGRTWRTPVHRELWLFSSAVVPSRCKRLPWRRRWMPAHRCGRNTLTSWSPAGLRTWTHRACKSGRHLEDKQRSTRSDRTLWTTFTTAREQDARCCLVEKIRPFRTFLGFHWPKSGVFKGSHFGGCWPTTWALFHQPMFVYILANWHH